MKRYWFEIEEGNDEIVKALASEIGVEIHEEDPDRKQTRKKKGGGSWSRSRFVKFRGAGFGDHVWRRNAVHNRIEASFSKPCESAKSLKRFGFKWLNEDGIWYSEISHYNEMICNSLNLSHVEDVKAA